MVRILSTGEIVQDDDPRLRPNNAPTRNRMGQIQHDEDDYDQQRQQQGGQGGYGAQAYNVFHSFNERLSGMGIPRWNLGPYVVEPIVSVGFLIALLLAGFRGLIFAGILFFVSKYSQQGGGGWRGFGGGGGGNQPGPRQSPQNKPGPGPGSGPGTGQGRGGGKKWGSGGGGQRLGRN